MITPTQIQLIGQEVAIAWSDGGEGYFPVEVLRGASPSAENIGERDIFGKVYGGARRSPNAGVTVRGWEQVGNYALRFTFSDGHGSGLYTYDYLRQLAEKIRAEG